MKKLDHNDFMGAESLECFQCRWLVMNDGGLSKMREKGNSESVDGLMEPKLNIKQQMPCC